MDKPRKAPRLDIKLNRTNGVERVCLRCNKLFPSTGPGNRICQPCDYLNHKVRDGYQLGGVSPVRYGDL